MKKSYLTLLLSIGLAMGVKAQSGKESSLRYVYSETTEEAINELEELTKGERTLKDNAYRLMRKYQKSGVIFLSSDQYGVIVNKIESPCIK